MTLILVVHVVAGVIAFASGAAALAAVKGGPLHRKAGNIFVASMLVMGLLGAYLAALLPQRGTIIGGVFACYLVATAWLTVRGSKQPVSLRWLALLIGAGCAAGDLSWGWRALQSGVGVDGVGSGPYFVFGAVAGLASLADLRVITFGIDGVDRIARHLWRMCAALLITTGSFFANGLARLLPAHTHIWPLLIAAMGTLLGLMLYWLWRVYFTGRFRAAPSS
jgi:hypothetical protein